MAAGQSLKTALKSGEREESTVETGQSFWQCRLSHLKTVLEKNGVEVFLAEDAAQARSVVLEQIIPQTGARRISRGGSMTALGAQLYDVLREDPAVEFVEPFGEGLSPEARLERLRQSLLVDLYITGTNAVTEAGQLVNLDMIGNRVGGIAFGPKYVVVLIGRNKIVPDLDAAMRRVRNYAAPLNARRAARGPAGALDRAGRSWSARAR